ncbi:helix-turn-helix transcriptional regulator [Streptomyces sp. SID8374]|uniref:LuxR C-terminal-related transcriptional regulator n=1 Tax=Streptomyces sp. SID8374 TaxID=2690354 RepID=UPI001369D9F0|nr:LuxR C-terminal-related transcriptional regulator [Streptomyces sp. SID8374]MYX15248.1 helix-turn-helix transcriptional regulator [Streptomyces sp. SID8374]
MCTTAESTDGAGTVHGLCESAMSLYATALREGHLPRTDLAEAPCLIQRGLVHPDPDDERWVRPVPPSAALTRLLRPFAQEVFERLDTTAALVDALLPLTSIAGREPHPEITVVSGKPAIQESLEEAGRRTREHILTLHPGSKRPAELLERARKNALPPLRRGVSVRHIYQHSARYNLPLNHYVDRLPYDGLQIRTMEQTPERLFIFDRIAYLPTSSRRDVALRITHPALVRYLIHVYDVLWAAATPFDEPLPTALPNTPLTAVQHSIARLLAEGHVDDVVARKMGISVRTCRSHIAKLMQSLGATSRTHLGALLARSGIARAGHGGA